MDAEGRERLRAAGLTPDDFSWFDSFQWSDSDVPEPEPTDIAAYRRREAALNASISELTFSERGASPAGKLAAAIGARCAQAEDLASGDDDN